MAIGYKSARKIDIPNDVNDVIKSVEDKKISYESLGISDNIPYGNLRRIMTDDQLRELFETGDIPTNDDFIAIIDSKLNKADVVDVARLEKVLSDVKDYVGGSLFDKADKSDTYTKSDVDNLIRDSAGIDDVNISETKVWSSYKTNNELNRVKTSLDATDGVARESWMIAKNNETSILSLQEEVGVNRTDLIEYANSLINL